MSPLTKVFTVVLFVGFSLPAFSAGTPKNKRFQELKQEMWIQGLNTTGPKNLGEQPQTIEEITANLPKISEIQAQEALPEELDYVLHKFGHKL